VLCDVFLSLSIVTSGRVSASQEMKRKSFRTWLTSVSNAMSTA